MATYVSGSETLIREDLSDLIANLSPAEAPAHAAFEHLPITQPITEYGVDQFILNRTISTISSNARNEGATTTYETTTYPDRLKSLAQINWVGVDVSETDRASLIAGIPDPFEYRAYRALVQVVNTQEMAIWWGSGSATTAAPRLMQGLVSWCGYTGLERVHGSSSPTSVTDPHGTVIADEFWSNMYDAAGANLDRGILNNKILGAAWQNGFQVDGAIGFMGQKLKNLTSAFALTAQGAINERNVPAYDKVFVDTLDAIETPMGTVWVNLNRYLELPAQTLTINSTGAASPAGTINKTLAGDETCIFAMPDYVKLGVLRGVAFRPMANDADTTKGMIVGEETVVVRNPIALTGGTNLLA